MSQTVFTLHTSSFDTSDCTYLKIGVPCPRGKWFTRDNLKPMGQGIDFASCYLYARQLWQDGSIKWLHLEGIVKRTDTEITGDIPIALTTASCPLNNRVSPVVDTPNTLSITLNNEMTMSVAKNELLSIETHALQSRFFQYGSTNNITIVNTDYELVSNNGVYQAVIIKQSAKVNKEGEKHVVIDAEYTVLLNCGCVHGTVSMTNPSPASHPHGKWDLGDPNSVYINEYGLQLTGATQCAVDIKKRNFEITNNDTMSVYQASSGHINWNSPVHANAENNVTHTLKGFEVVKNEQRIDHGNQCNPVLKCGALSRNLYVQTKDFWQNFPSSITVSKDTVVMSLLGSRYADPIELQPGEQKSREFTIAPNPCDKARVSFSPQWIKNTNVLPFFTDTPSRFHTLIQQGIDGDASFFEKRIAIDEFGWRHFGELYADHESVLNREKNLFVSHYNNQYDPVFGMLQQWLITGDAKWFELADDLARHVADIDIYHTQLDKPEYSGGLFWHTDHYVQAYTATHRTYSTHQPSDVYEDHAGGGGPGGQHCYTNGLTLHYLLTGYGPSKKAVTTMANWIERYYEGDGTLLGAALALRNRNIPGLKDIKTGQYPLDRGTGNYVQALLDRFVLYDQLRDIELAGHVIQHTLSSSDDIAERRLDDVENTWFYTVMLQAVCRFIKVKAQLSHRDHYYQHAVNALKHYAMWMVKNEYAYLDKPDILEFPNQTWSGQDLRKLCVLNFAQSYLKQRMAAFERISELTTSIYHRLSQSDESTNTRVLCLMMQNANYQGYTGESAPPVDNMAPCEKDTTSLTNQHSFVGYMLGLLRSVSLSRERTQLVKRFPVCQKWLGKP